MQIDNRTGEKKISKKELINEINEQFDNIWENIIYVLIIDYKKRLNMSCRFINIKKIIMKKLYKKYNFVFMKRFMKGKFMRIDMHKISSALMKCILCVRPLKIRLIDYKSVYLESKNDNRFRALFNANELLAIATAISVMNSCLAKKPFPHKIILPVPFIYSPEQNDADVKENELLINDFSNNNKAYIYDICVDLSYTKGRRFNLVTYANICFLLEKYSCRRVQSYNLESELRNILLDSEIKTEDNIDDFIKEIRFRTNKENSAFGESQDNS